MKLRHSATPIFVLLTACSSDPPTEPASINSHSLRQSTTAQYLPYGVPVPATSMVDLAPEPYDVERHGPPRPNSTPQLNLAQFPGIRTSVPTHVLNRFSTPTEPPQGGSFRGPLWPSTFYTSIYSGHNTQLNMILPQPTDTTTFLLYAPTAMPSGSACLEMTTIHRRSPGQSTRHRAGWWDWCTDPNVNSFAYEEDMTNSTWQSNYTRLDASNGRYYFITISFGHDGQGNKCWSGLIYNYNTGAWESKIARCYAPGQTMNVLNNNDGWSLWEWKQDKVCPSSFARTSATNIRIRASTTGWVGVTTVYPTKGGGSGCWTRQPSWGFDYPISSATPSWRALTP